MLQRSKYSHEKKIEKSVLKQLAGNGINVQYSAMELTLSRT